MSKDLVVKKDLNTEHDLSIIEKVLMQGDLSKLDPTQRVVYYNKVCESLGLNPYTRPFEYISLSGKLTLYAKKDATEQLRKVNNISITGLEGRLVEDLYIVVAKASTPNGRTDQATGAVSIGNLKGEQKANAIMKAETKAKRRVTLSISGMGWTDETEIESIPNAIPVKVDFETGEIDVTPVQPEKKTEDLNGKSESKPFCMDELKIFGMISLMKANGEKFEENMNKHISENYKTTVDKLTEDQYIQILKWCKMSADAEKKEKEKVNAPS